MSYCKYLKVFFRLSMKSILNQANSILIDLKIIHLKLIDNQIIILNNSFVVLKV